MLIDLPNNRAKDGHPTQFLKILHYALFGSSTVVRDHLFNNGIDRDIVHLNDIKFVKSVIYLLVSKYQNILELPGHVKWQ